MRESIYILCFLVWLLPVLGRCAEVDEQLDSCAKSGENSAWLFVRENKNTINVNNFMSKSESLPSDKLSSAVMFGFKHIVSKMIHNHPEILGKYGGNALVVAAQMGRINMTRLLLNRGVSPNARDINGLTAIYEAAVYGCSDEISYLVSHGANVNIHANVNWTPMIAAVAEHHYVVAATLLENGYKVTPEEYKKIHKLLLRQGKPSVWEFLFDNLLTSKAQNE